MTILLENHKTGLYVADPSAWVETSHEARVFSSVDQATRYVDENGLAHCVRIVVLIHQGGYNVLMPLSAFATDPESSDSE